jgi:putative flavoprotein involved in K+ transport
VAVVGGGQAGLATSYWLRELDIDHVVLERGRTGDAWRHRWDSFCLVTPNWTLKLPGFPYQGGEPDGFLPREAIVDYLVSYRESFEPPVRDGVEVTSLTSQDGHWRLETDDGAWEAEHVVVATGPFPFPSIPPPSRSLHGDVTQLHSHDYRSPDALPDGGVLVVGSAQSGCQIVDDLHMAGRDVWLAVSRAGRAPRRYRGKDTTWWLGEMGFAEQVLEDPEARFMANPHVSGRDGGKDLNLRAFGRDGVHLVGRVVQAKGSLVTFADDVVERLEAADQASREIEHGIDEFIEAAGIDAPPDDREPIDWVPAVVPEQVDLVDEGISSVIWATGYHLDFSWIDAPVFGERDYPIHQRGITDVPGLYFIGLAALHTVGSSLFWGVGRDAEFLASHIASS